MKLAHLLENLRDHFFVSTCVICGVELAQGFNTGPITDENDEFIGKTNLICKTCLPQRGSRVFDFDHPEFPRCQGCQTPLAEFSQSSLTAVKNFKADQTQQNSQLCLTCSLDQSPIRSIRSIWYFDTAVESILKRYKYCNQPGLGLVLGEALSRYLDALSTTDPLYSKKPWNLIVPVPSTLAKEKERRFSPTALISQALARKQKIGLSLSALVSTSKTGNQAQRPICQRAANVKDGFMAKAKIIRDARILLVDDTITSSATVKSCGATLLENYAESIDVITVGRSRNLQTNRLKLLFSR